MFSEVCVRNSVHGGGSASMHARIPPPWDKADTTPPLRTRQAPFKMRQVPTGTRHPPGARHHAPGTSGLNQATPEQSMLGDTVNERAVCILLEYNLVTDVVRDEYKGYPNKRLTNNVIKTVMTSSAFQCTTWCSMTDGCLAVNVIGNHDITCELTTGLSDENEMQDYSSSQLLVSSKNNALFS